MANVELNSQFPILNLQLGCLMALTAEQIHDTGPNARSGQAHCWELLPAGLAELGLTEAHVSTDEDWTAEQAAAEADALLRHPS